MNEKRGCGQENESEIKSEKIAKNSEKRNSEATQAVPSLLYLYFRQRNIPDSFGRCRTQRAEVVQNIIKVSNGRRILIV